MADRISKTTLSYEILFSGALGTSNANYSLSESTEHFQWIAICTRWYNGMNDNIKIIPSSLWETNEYLDIHRHELMSDPYVRINGRGPTGIDAYVTDVGVYVSIYGIGRIA